MAPTFPALNVLHDLHVESTVQLLGPVSRAERAMRAAEAKQGKRSPATKPNTAPLPEFGPGGTWPGTIRPFDALQLLSEAMLPTLPRAEFDVAKEWSLYRYFWAFASPNSRSRALRLSGPAYGLVDHHRTLSSEQLGVALAMHLAQWIITQRHPGDEVRWVDADIALDRGALDPQGLLRTVPGGKRRMRPDYFFWARDRATKRIVVYAVEAKGSHSPRLWESQMAKASRQVAAVRISSRPGSSGGAPTGLIFCSTFDDNQIVVRALDPEGDDDWAGPVAEEPLVGRPREQALRFDQEADQILIDDPERVRRSMVEAAEASLLAYAGQYGSAAALLGEDSPLSDAALEQDETPVGDVLYRSSTLPLGDRHLVVRTGVRADVLQALRPGSEQSANEAREELRAISADRPGLPSGAVWIDVDNDGRRVEGMQPHGGYLRVEVA